MSCFKNRIKPFLIFVSVCFTCGVATAIENPPNVVFILADDLGWSDTTLYGKTDFYKTPHVQRLSKRGITFTRAYAASPLCSPTRASILTGLHPARVGITSPTCHLPQVVLESKRGVPTSGNVPSVANKSATRLDTRYYTLGEAFQDAGYVTGHFGKWHLGHEPYSPLEHGFGTDVPHWPGPGPAGSFVAPWKFPDFDPDVPNEHIEDRMANEAVKFIKQNRDKPFFLNYWMFSVHAPFDAKKKLIQKYRAKLNPNSKQRSPTYAAMVESMDDAVGKLMAALDAEGLREKTLVIFFSDNGGNMYNQVDGVPPTNNYPLRGGKATMFEGGIRVPCTISFPGRFAEGITSNQLVQSTDFFPTLIDLTGIKPRKEVAFDGQSIAPTLNNLVPNKKNGNAVQSEPKDRDLFTYFPHQPRVPAWLPPSVSVHSGDWKLIRILHAGAGDKHRHMLFNLDKDVGESNNLAGEFPELVKKLGKKIDDFLSKSNAVVPIRNVGFDFEKYDVSQEGVSQIRATGKRAPGKKVGPKRQQPKVAGWRPNGQCQLSLNKGLLRVESLGGDPNFSFDFSKPLPAGKYKLTFDLSGGLKGNGQLFWQEQGVTPKFFRERSKVFSLGDDGDKKRYQVEFESGNPIPAIRLDPGQRRGKGTIHSITLSGELIEDRNLLQAPTGKKSNPTK